MSVSETYVALANGFLGPTALAPITIFEHNEYLYCIDTRRLTIAKELQRRGKFDILKRFPVQYAKRGVTDFADQYRNLINDRLPAMKRDGLDGSTIKLYSDSRHMCCYNSNSGRFRDDLEEHIARDHLNMDVSDFRKLNVSRCSRCNRKVDIIINKPSTRGFYKFMQNWACKHSETTVLHATNKPWPEITLREICDIFYRLKENTLTGAVTSQQDVLLSTQWQSPFSHRTSLTNSPLSNNDVAQEEKKDTFIKRFCAFLLRSFFIIILSWLMFIYFSKQDR